MGTVDGWDFSNLFDYTTNLGDNSTANWNTFGGSSGWGGWGDYLKNTDWLSAPTYSTATNSGLDWSSLVNSGLGKTALTTGAGLLGNYLSSSAQGNQSQAYADYVNSQSNQALANYEKYLKGEVEISNIMSEKALK
jgi:hypothetical protein